LFAKLQKKTIDGENFPKKMMQLEKNTTKWVEKTQKNM